MNVQNIFAVYTVCFVSLYNDAILCREEERVVTAQYKQLNQIVAVVLPVITRVIACARCHFCDILD